ncbi:MAG: PadR family transcriptional regulator [Candidatus Lokiarchaeota archaeon]|nr:PadR family transcriptional regulator [Candidatus Lokiarchaeota archaeon]
MSDLNEDAKKFVDRMEKQMKRGFIQIVVLAMLSNGSSHGYQIIKNFEENPIWNATASSIYPILKSLCEKNFIDYNEKKDGERTRKVYQITKKGEKALELIHERHTKILTSINSIAKLRINDHIKRDSPFPIPRLFLSHVNKIIEGSNSDELHKLKTKIEILIQNLNQLLEKIKNKIDKKE